MENKIWTKQFDHTIDLGTLLGEEYANTKIEDWFNNLEEMNEEMQYVVEEARSLEFTHPSTGELVKDFEVGWGDLYSENGNFYKGGPKLDEIYQLLNGLTDQGFDIKLYWKKFAQNLEDIWNQLPTFGMMKGENTIPDDYQPEKPFPQYPLPLGV